MAIPLLSGNPLPGSPCPHMGGMLTGKPVYRCMHLGLQCVEGLWSQCLPRTGSSCCRAAAAAVTDPYTVAENIMAMSAGSRTVAEGLDVASMLKEARMDAPACS